LEDRQREPGAEHFLLASFDLPDGTARLSFENIGADPSGLRPAIHKQYIDPLIALGVDADTAELVDMAPLPARNRLYDAAPSGKAVMQTLAKKRREHRPLLGAHVVAVVAEMRHGVAARALRAMGIDPSRLKTAAENMAGAHLA